MSTHLYLPGCARFHPLVTQGWTPRCGPKHQGEAPGMTLTTTQWWKWKPRFFNTFIQNVPATRKPETWPPISCEWIKVGQVRHRPRRIHSSMGRSLPDVEFLCLYIPTIAHQNSGLRHCWLLVVKTDIQRQYYSWTDLDKYRVASVIKHIKTQWFVEKSLSKDEPKSARPT